jgi:hypothetical protein
MSSSNEDDTSNAPGGETSADHMISESGKQTEPTKGKKSASCHSFFPAAKYLVNGDNIL